MPMIDLHYPLTGLLILAGGIGFMKAFDFLASQSVKRLLEMANACRENQTCE